MNTSVIYLLHPLPPPPSQSYRFVSLSLQAVCQLRGCLARKYVGNTGNLAAYGGMLLRSLTSRKSAFILSSRRIKTAFQSWGPNIHCLRYYVRQSVMYNRRRLIVLLLNNLLHRFSNRARRSPASRRFCGYVRGIMTNSRITVLDAAVFRLQIKCGNGLAGVLISEKFL